MPIADFYYPFDSIDGDRVITAAAERRFWSKLFNDGVVGTGGFAITKVSAGVYDIAPGVGIVGGMIGGTTTTKRVTVAGDPGTTKYITLNGNTYPTIRKVSIEVVKTPQYASQEQLDAAGVREVVLYRVDIDANGVQAVTDMRTYCTSFDASQWASKIAEAIDNISADAAAALEDVRTQLDTMGNTIEASAAGLYGGAGRQGFINPQFLVNQRGRDIYSLTGGSMYTFDRWRVEVTGTATTPTRVDNIQDGARHALRLEFPALGTGVAAVELSQSIEGGVRTFCTDARAFTVSFDAFALEARPLVVEVKQYAEPGGEGVTFAQAVTVENGWRRYSVTFNGSVELADTQTADVLKVAFVPAWSGNAARFGADNASAGVVYFANMQINEGAQALACYARPYADELEACQRYYVALGAVSLPVGPTAAATAHTAPLPLTRRLYRVPTVSSTDRVGVLDRASIEVSSGDWHHGMTWTISDDSTDAPVFKVVDAGASRVCFGSLALDAEITD